MTQLELNQFKSHQLIRPKNIKIIEELNISIKIEHSKYVHLQIKDFNKKRWEVPHEILNEEYFRNINKTNNTPSFEMEYLKSNEKFYFNLYFNSKNEKGIMNKNIFYKFNISQNFLFSNNYINFESQLTTDNIYGFGERIHNFKLNKGLYTIWSMDRKCFYDDGTGGKNVYGHQPIGLHKTKYKNIWLGFIFLNTNAQDIKIYKKNNETILSHKTIGGVIDYYIIVDNSPENVLRDIHYLIGIPTLPPYWSLGNHQSRWGFHNFIEFQNVYETYKSEEISIEAMWLDIDSYKEYLIFTLDDDNFKELPDYINIVIHKDHGYFIPILGIGITYDKSNLNKYADIGDKYNLFIKSGYTKKNLKARIWPGLTVYPDFFNPNIDKLWNKGLDYYYNII